MAEAKDIYGGIYQNLIDAGCDQQMTELCMTFVKEGQFSDIVPVLTRHRKDLLDSVHKGQKQIDCLDYLLYKIMNTAPAISAITALSSVNDAPGIASFLRLVLTKITCTVFTVISATLY